MTYDKKLAAQEAIMAEWGSADSYATRVNDLTSGGGLNGLARSIPQRCMTTGWWIASSALPARPGTGSSPT
jgi:hypothetical protein